MNDKIYFFVIIIIGIQTIWWAYKNKSMVSLMSGVILISLTTNNWPLFFPMYIGFSIIGIFTGICALFEFFKEKNNNSFVYGILLLMFGLLSFVYGWI